MTEQEFLKNYDITQYPQPSVAADIVLFTLDQKHTEKTIGLGPLQVFHRLKTMGFLTDFL